MDSYIGLILQIVTILTTVSLGLITAYQTRKIQKRQNILSVTTSYRQKRSEQLKELGHVIMAYSTPELTEVSEESALSSFTRVCDATAYFSTLLHTCFDQDAELIALGEAVQSAQFEYLHALYRSGNRNEARLARIKKYLCGCRKRFIIKCDMYTYAEWDRIKKETNGINTYAKEFIDYYNLLQEKYADKWEKTNQEYADVLDETAPRK